MKKLSILALFALVVTIVSPVLGQNFDPQKVILTSYNNQQVQDIIGNQVGDLDNDGANDVCIWTGSAMPFNCAYIRIMYGNGIIDSFPYHDCQPFWAGGMKIADLENDNYPEIIVGFHDSIKIFWNSKNIGIKPNNFSALRSGIMVNWFDAGDLDLDGLGEIVIPHAGEDSISIFWQISPKNFGLKKYFYVSGQTWDRVIIKSERVYIKTTNAILAWRFNVKREIDTAFVAISIPLLPGLYYAFDVFDTNGDLQEDIIYSSVEDNWSPTLGIAYGPNFTNHLKVKIGTVTNNGAIVSLGCADIDCDGDAEIVGESGHIYMFDHEMNFKGQLNGASTCYAWQSALSVVDITGDKAPEIINACNTGVWYYQNISPVCLGFIKGKQGKQKTLSVSPNPANESIFINSFDEIQILDTTGRVVFKGFGGNVNISGLAPGVYIVKSVKTDRSDQGVRFIKK